MAANDVIVFDASTSESDSSPVKKHAQPKPHTSSNSDSDTEPIVKKKRATRRRPINNRPPLEDIQNEDMPNVAVYTKALPSLFGTIRTNILPTEIDGDDVEEEEKVLKPSKKTGAKRSSRKEARSHEPDICLIDDDNDEDSTRSAQCELPRDRSPTPPPSTPRDVRRRQRRKPRTPKAATQAIGNLEILRGRLQRSHTYGFDQVVGDDDDDLILVDDVGSPESPQKGLVVKIKSVHHGIQRFQMKRSETFEGVLQKIADKEDVDMDKVVIFHKDHSIEPYDTPRALQLTVADILTCHIVRREASTDSDGSDDSLDDLDDPSMVRLKIQGKSSRSTNVTIRIKRTDPLERLMREYAMKCGLNHESLTFTFDGDVVRKSQTPESLEMEDDDCLDVAGS